MKSAQILIAFTLTFLGLGLGGCSASAAKMTGFLSNYDNLEKVSDTSYRFTAVEGALAEYDRFIVDPIVVYHHGEEEKTPSPELEKLAEYFRDAIISGLSVDYTVVDSAGSRTARVRIALTDVKKSKWYLNLHPVSKLTGSGTGQATMEGELLDSVSGAQIAALVESQRGNQFELDHFSKFDDARDVIDEWTIRFLVSLDDAHGR